MSRPRLGRRAVLAGSLSALATPALVRAQTVDTFRIMLDFPATPTHSPLFLAEQKGWFRDAGLQISILDGRGSAATIQLIASGGMDLGYVDMSPLFQARQAGMKVKSAMAFTRKGALGAMYALDSGIKTVQDLAGRQALCFAGSAFTPALIRQFFVGAGVDPKSVDVLNVDPNALYALYMSRKADVVLSPPPHGVPLVEPVRPAGAFMGADYGLMLPGYGLAVREDHLQQHRDSLQRLATALARSWTYILAGNEVEAVQAVATLRPDAHVVPVNGAKDVRNYSALVATDATRGKPFGWQSDIDWAAYLKTMEEAGILKPGHAPSEFYTNELIAPVG